jgi:hypothetical protein
MPLYYNITWKEKSLLYIDSSLYICSCGTIALDGLFGVDQSKKDR